MAAREFQYTEQLNMCGEIKQSGKTLESEER